MALLRGAAGRHPDDVWVNYDLADGSGELRPAPGEEAVRYYSAARAVRARDGPRARPLLDDMGRTDEALAVFADLVARRPDDARHLVLRRCLKDHGRPEAAAILDRAVAACREAIRLKPDDALAHFSLGLALRPGEAWTRRSPSSAKRSGSSPTTPWPTTTSASPCEAGEAGRGGRRAPRGDPAQARLRRAHNNLGTALHGAGQARRGGRRVPRGDPAQARRRRGPLRPRHRPERQGKLEEAIAAYREAIRLKPDYAGAHFNLGVVLQIARVITPGRWPEFRGQWVELGNRSCRAGRPLGGGCEEAERKAALAERLPALLKGDDRPQDNAERLAFAQICYDQRTPRRRRPLLGRGAGRRPEARRRPSGPAPLQRRLRRRAGRRRAGKDDPPPDDAAKAKLRGQALDWLKAERDAWAKLLDGGDPKERTRVAHQLQDWKVAPELASVRDPAALAKLPDAERELGGLWTDVDALHKRAAGGAP